MNSARHITRKEGLLAYILFIAIVGLGQAQQQRGDDADKKEAIRFDRAICQVINTNRGALRDVAEATENQSIMLETLIKVALSPTDADSDAEANRRAELSELANKMIAEQVAKAAKARRGVEELSCAGIGNRSADFSEQPAIKNGTPTTSTTVR